MIHVVVAAGVSTVFGLLIRRESRILQGYESKANAQKGVEVIMTAAPGATLGRALDTNLAKFEVATLNYIDVVQPQNTFRSSDQVAV